MTTTTRATRPETSRIPDVVDLLTSLVACDSTNPTGEEESTAALLGEALAAAGFETTIDTLAPGKVNLTARLRLGAGGRSIMLNSHLDVVPAGIGWTSAPFEPEVRDGRLFGRGSADAKGPLAAMACAAIELAQSGTITTGEIVYSAVSQEEGDSAGARRLVPELVGAGRLPDAVIVGEPTGMRLLTAHKGSIRPVIEVVGRSAHAATPQFGVNAVVAAGQLLGLLEDYATELGGRRHPLLGAATCTPVLVGGGEAPNAVPERCRITLDRRLLPDESPDAVLTAINEVLARFAEQTPGATASVAELAPSTGGPRKPPATTRSSSGHAARWPLTTPTIRSAG